MSTYKNLLFETDEAGIATITVNRPTKLNALNIETINDIRLAIEEVMDREDVIGAIFTGAGEKAFVAGADIAEIAALNEVNCRKFSENGQEVFSLIESCNKPVIAAVNGFALGGGCELAMACHIRIAVKNAKFGQPEVNLGLIPGYGGTQRLTQLIGKGKALELMMTAELISAEEANRLGLANYVTETADEMLALARKIIGVISKKAPIAIGLVIECVNAVYGSDNGYQTEANSFSSCCRSEDFREGVSAFLEKRPAVFKNR